MDKRLNEMLFRFRARNYPETLSSDEQAEWLEHCQTRLLKGESGFLSFENFYAEIAQCRSEENLDDLKSSVLDEVERFGRELEAFVTASS